jgi:hypothetical protein
MISICRRSPNAYRAGLANSLAADVARLSSISSKADRTYPTWSFAKCQKTEELGETYTFSMRTAWSYAIRETGKPRIVPKWKALPLIIAPR